MNETIAHWNSIVPRPVDVRPLSTGDSSVDGIQISEPITVSSDNSVLARDVAAVIAIALGESSVRATDSATATVFVDCENPGGQDGAIVSQRESWQLECGGDSEQIVIHSTHRLGALRAAASLAQALAVSSLETYAPSSDQGARRAIVVPRAVVSGDFAFSWRGGMLDCSRHMMSIGFIKRFIDLLALHGMNIFHWHLTDDQGWRLPSNAYPELERKAAWRDDNTTRYGHYGGIYTGDDIASVVEHATRRGVTVVPEIDIPGHVSAVLHAYPQFGCRGEELDVPVRHGIFEDVLCAGSNEVHTFLETVFDELCDLFPGPYIHLGGDECPSTRWSECPKCRARMEELGINDPALLHGHLVESAANAIRRRGRTPVGWDEVLEGGPPAGMLIMCWRDVAHARPAIESGYDVVICPTNCACYFDHKHRDDPDELGRLSVCTVEDTYGFNPGGLKSEGRKTGNSHGTVVGSQGNIWTEGIPCGKHAEYMAFPRMAALSEVLAGTARRSESLALDLERIRAHARRLRLLGVNAYDGPPI